MRSSLCSGRAISLALVIFGCTACSDDQYVPARCSDFERTAEPLDIPIAYATEHLDIHVEDGRLLCAGSAQDYENFYQYVSDELDGSLSHRVSVYILNHVSEFCRDGAIGCRTQDGAVFATLGATHHELAHVATCDWRSGSAPFLAEGLAVSFEVTPLTASSDPREFIAAKTSRDVHYDGAGHFVRWLLEERGSATFRGAYQVAPRAGGEGVFAVLEEAYARDIDALIADYDASAPYMWVPHRQCADLKVLEPIGGEWNFAATFDCEDPSTLGPYERASDGAQSDITAGTSMYQSFLLEIESPGTYRFEREADTGVWIERCLTEVALSEEQADQLWLKEGLFADLQGATEVALTTGTYRIDVRRQYAEPHPVWLRIEPSGG